MKWTLGDDQSPLLLEVIVSIWALGLLTHNDFYWYYLLSYAGVYIVYHIASL